MNAPRKKTGPKTGLPADRTVSRRSVTYDDMTDRKLTTLGAGNASLGIRFAADVAYDLYQKGRLVLPGEGEKE